MMKRFFLQIEYGFFFKTRASGKTQPIALYEKSCPKNAISPYYREFFERFPFMTLHRNERRARPNAMSRVRLR
jgi:hypothetical protein